METKKLVSNVMAVSFIALIFTFAFTWIIFEFTNTSDSLKDTWTIVSGTFGGFATLAAAYIAANLFNDWRDQQDHNNIFHFGNEAYKAYKDFDNLFNEIIEELIFLKEHYNHITFKNTPSLIPSYIEKSTEVSSKNLSLLKSFNKFIREAQAYNIIISKKYDFEESYEELTSYVSSLGDIKYEKEIIDRNQLVEKLLSEPFCELNNNIYKIHIKSILNQIKINKNYER